MKKFDIPKLKGKKPKFMLSIAPWDMWEGEPDTIYPLGIAYLAAVLEKEGYEVDVLNLTYGNWEDAKEEVAKRIKKFDPDFFGISILSNSRISALKLISVVKEIKPDIPIFAGGVHTTFMYEQILNAFPVDIAVLGEGEITTIECLDAIIKKKSVNDFKAIKGIAFKHEGKIIKTELRERIRNLDDLPIPKHELFKEIIIKTKNAFIMSSRGCPFGCSFCPSSAFWGRCITKRSPENVVKEIMYLLKHFPTIEQISFEDDEFACDNNRTIGICNLLIKNNIKIKWTCLARVSSINEELIILMKKAGCIQITFGMESGSQRILDLLGKKVKIDELVKAYKLCKKYDIAAGVLTIVGLPGENKKSVNETIKTLRKMGAVSEPAILIIYPGTEVYRLAKEKGLMTDEYWLGEGLCPLYTCEHPKWKLWLWAFKIGFVSHFYNGKWSDIKDPPSFSNFLYRKIII